MMGTLAVKGLRYLNLQTYKNISKTSTNKYGDIGSPCLGSLSNLKFFVVFPPLMMQDSWFFIIVLIQPTKSIPNAKILNFLEQLFSEV